MPPTRPNVDIPLREEDSSTKAEKTYHQAGLEVIAKGKKGNAAQKKRTAAANLVDETRDSHDAAKASLARAHKRAGDGHESQGNRHHQSGARGPQAGQDRRGGGEGFKRG